jgi:hypothetical protein
VYRKRRRITPTTPGAHSPQPAPPNLCRFAPNELQMEASNPARSMLCPAKGVPQRAVGLFRLQGRGSFMHGMKWLPSALVLLSACDTNSLGTPLADAALGSDVDGSVDASSPAPDSGGLSEIRCPQGVLDESVVELRTRADLAAMEGCREVTGALFIYDTGLGSLSALHALERVGDDLSIGPDESGNPGTLVSLAGLESLREVGSKLFITGNPVLNDVTALAGLTRVPGLLMIGDNPALESLEGLHHLARSGGLMISGNALRDLKGLRGLTELQGRLELRREPLRTLAGLSALESAYQVEFSALPQLEELGLSALSSVEQQLWIDHNPKLRELTSLSSLRHVAGDLIVVRNPELDESAAQTWAAQVQVDGVRKVLGNSAWRAPTGNTCAFQNDGICDAALELCASGTDAADCVTGD